MRWGRGGGCRPIPEIPMPGLQKVLVLDGITLGYRRLAADIGARARLVNSDGWFDGIYLPNATAGAAVGICNRQPNGIERVIGKVLAGGGRRRRLIRTSKIVVVKIPGPADRTGCLVGKFHRHMIAVLGCNF